ncbi:MAG: Uma2 family endonuclease [Tannerella sp.]|nr:Uma2 family endonuclease [Tannerella sp.]
MMKEYTGTTDIVDDKSVDKVNEPIAPYISHGRLYTYADYLTWADDIRREIIDGLAYLLSAPTRFHAGISHKISFFMELFVRKQKGHCQIYQAPFDVRLPKNGETADNEIYTVVQPDICVICDLSKLDDRGCIGAPDLIVEVQSPSTAKRDLNEKYFLYERVGVKEYWVVFPRDKGLTVFLRQENGKFDDGTPYQFEGKVQVSIFQGLEIDLKDLFEDE